MESVDVPFIFNQITADFQEISIQGQTTYRVTDAKQLSQLLNFTLDNTGSNYISSDPIGSYSGIWRNHYQTIHDTGITNG